MGSIIVTCPVTGKEIDTGIETDPESFARISTIRGRVWCPHCGAEHEWTAETARLRNVGDGEGK